MKPRVYIETSIVSYLVARPSRDIIVAAHQDMTRDWWEQQKEYFELYTSPIVTNEASAGDTTAAQQRLLVLAAIPSLLVSPEAVVLAENLLSRGALPQRAREDALHIAVAAVHGMDYLLTWNCTHIANALTRSIITSIIERQAFAVPIICTPEELITKG
jgi:predicted nucleic acid-binding protein